MKSLAWNEFMRATGRPKNVVSGVSSGAQSMIKGVAAGAATLIAAPVIGAQQEGTSGFFKGLGAGLSDFVDEIYPCTP